MKNLAVPDGGRCDSSHFSITVCSLYLHTAITLCWRAETVNGKFGATVVQHLVTDCTPFQLRPGVPVPRGTSLRLWEGEHVLGLDVNILSHPVVVW